MRDPSSPLSSRKLERFIDQASNLSLSPLPAAALRRRYTLKRKKEKENEKKKTEKEKAGNDKLSGERGTRRNDGIQ